MKAITKITAITLLAAIMAMGACKSSDSHWHKTTKAEREAKKQQKK